MNEINLALHQHNTSRNHSTTATQGAAARGRWRARVTAGAGGGGAGGGFGRLSCCVVRGFAAFTITHHIKKLPKPIEYLKEKY